MRTSNARIVLGTRGSELAVWQTEWVKARLQAAHPDLTVEVKVIRTTGDVNLTTPLAEIGDKGLFTKELESALTAGEIDAAVHSLKDMPTQLPDGLDLGAISDREDPRDAFVPHPSSPELRFSNLRRSATIATGSLRRTSQILAHRPDLIVEGLRGNVHTRLRKLEQSEWSGVVLAAAGLKRLGLQARISELLPVELVLPAVGQGALAIEIRTDDRRIREFLRSVESPEVRAAVTAERALLRRLEGGCQVPIGAYGTVLDRQLHLSGCIGSLNGSRMVRGELTGDSATAESLGVLLAEQLLKDGGEAILEDVRRNPGAVR